jgi:DNA repair exonuclease SbcCD ATPase subunit
VTRVPATELQATYEKLNSEFKRSESRAKEVRERIAAIDSVAQALFKEWNQELAEYTNASLRAQSKRQLAATQDRYADLMRVMEQAAARMDPVLDAFRDQVLFLKHNLNAQAISALGGTTRDLQKDISRLIADMEKSIKEADAFIAAMHAAP